MAFKVLLAIALIYRAVTAKIQAFIIWWGESLCFLFLISQCPVLSAIVSQLFPPLNHLYVCFRQDFASALTTEDSRSATNSPDITMVSAVFLVTKLYVTKLRNEIKLKNFSFYFHFRKWFYATSFIYLFIYLYIYLFTYLFIYLSIYLSVYVFIYLSIYPYILYLTTPSITLYT